MACLVRLKEDIKFLDTAFPKKHDRFQIISASVDEVACRFIGKNGERLVINANITVSLDIKTTYIFSTIYLLLQMI